MVLPCRKISKNSTFMYKKVVQNGIDKQKLPFSGKNLSK
jgi:hypothetical protein